jgi:tetratricopeptide (TPR) repeat protein
MPPRKVRVTPCFIAIVCLFPQAALISVAAQVAPPDPTAPQVIAPDYSKEAFLVQSSETRIRFTADGASVRTQTESIKILSEAAIPVWGVLQFPFASENEHVDVHYVRVLKADGATIPTPAANAMDLPSDVTRAAPMYSDLKQKQIPVKALGVGDTLQFEVAYVEDKPLVPGQFWYQYNFSRSFVILKELLEIRVPREKLPKIANADIKPVITNEGSEQIYTWTTSHTEATKPDGPDAQNTAADETDPEDQKPSVQLTTFQSWQQVGDWYAKLAQSQAKVTPEIQAKADGLVKGIPAADTNARTQAIYDYVSAHIHYISLSFGVGRYQPHTATDVLENEYGDCKDKHTLLAALLQAEGIESWPVLIGSSHKLDESIPSPAQFDHLITILPQGKNYLWLDSTPGVDPFAMLLFPLRDKQALVVPAAAPSFLLKTPADPPFPAEDHLTMRGSLDEAGTYTAHGDLLMRGDSEVIYRSIFHATARAKWQDVLQAISYRLGFGGEVSNVQIDDPDQTQKPFHLAWDYQRKKYGNWDQRQIIPPTGGIPIPIVSEDKKPKSPIQLGAPATTFYTGEIDLPPGATLESHPDLDVKTAFAEYHAKYTVEKGKFLAERTITVLRKEVPAAYWKDYTAFQKELTDDFNRFSTVFSPGTTGASTPAPADSPEAGELLDKAMQSCQSRELTSCEDRLDHVKKLNPHQTGLNAGYASLDLMHNKTDAAFQAMRDELKDHPGNLRAARWFLQVLSFMHRDSDALEIDRIILKTAPDDLDANTDAARILVAQENWKEAQPILEKTFRLRPDNPQIRIEYGQSCLYNGKESEGIDILKSAIGATTDPAQLATVADALASSGKAPDLALTAAKSAVSIMEQKTSAYTLADLTQPQIHDMVELAKAWNTMSLTALRSNDLATAEKFAGSSWQLAQEPIAGDRLAQVYEKQGQLPLALETYKLAKAKAYPQVPGIDDRIAALEKRMSHKGPEIEYGPAKLQDLRILHFPRQKPVTASADFLILFANGKVTEVKQLGGDSQLASYTTQIKEAKYNQTFPDQGPEHILRQGILSCSVYDHNCMFMLMLPADATATSQSSTPIPINQKTIPIQLKPN